MRKVLYYLVTMLAVCGIHTANAQQIEPVEGANIQFEPLQLRLERQINMLRTSSAASCSGDTNGYAMNKATGLAAISLNNATSANGAAQYFDCPQPLTISGVEFFAWSNPAPVQNVVVSIFAAGADSLPTGNALASVTVPVDSSFGGGALSALRQYGAFTNPVSVSAAYCVVVDNASPNTVALVCNDYNATTPDGLQEWLGHADLTGIGGSWLHGYELSVGGSPFDADWVVQPVVNHSLAASFSSNPGCVPSPTTVAFTNGSSPINLNRMYSLAAFFGVPRASFTWDFGDGSPTVNAVDTTHAYTAGGTYTVTLTDSLFGWTNVCVADTQITLAGAPTAQWSHSATNLDVNFTDMSSSGSSWLWDFGDGNTSTSQNPMHTYATPGTYMVCLTVTDVCGSDSSCTSITVSCAAPTASWSSSSNQLQVNFTDGSTVGSNPSYSWDFGDGNTSTMQNPTHTYAVDGSYLVCLIVSDDCNSDTLCDTVTVMSIGIANQLGADAISIYPNPTEGNAFAQIQLADAQDFDLNIYNSLGMKVRSYSFSGVQETKAQLDLNGLSNGTYLVELRTGNGVATKRLNILK